MKTSMSPRAKTGLGRAADYLIPAIAVLACASAAHAGADATFGPALDKFTNFLEGSGGKIIASAALVPTANGSRYMQQLCKHWAHNLQVEFTAERGSVVFPRDARGADWPADAEVTMDVRPDGLLCRIEASAPGQLEGLKGALARHLDRFAFREAPLSFDWQDE